MSLRFYNGALLISGGNLVMADECCCDPPCGCADGTKPSSIDFYFENCTGWMACLEGLTVNVPGPYPDDACGGTTDPTECICGSVWRISWAINTHIGTGAALRYALQLEGGGACPTGGLLATPFGPNFTAADCSQPFTGTFSAGSGSADYTATPIL